MPTGALEAKADRTQSGIVSLTGNGGRILDGAPSAESRFKDVQSYLEAVKTVPWVFACVSLLAYSLATAPGDLFDENDEPVVDETDPFLQVWHRPNPMQSGMVFKELMGMFIELAGEAFISLEKRDANGIPAEIYLPSPARMRVVQDKRSGDVIGYAYDTSGYQNGRYLPSFIPYEVDEIIHIKVANPLNMLHGLGNIEAMEVTMDTMVAMSQNELQYWKSGGRITGVLETDQQVDNDTFERLVNRWRQFSADKQARFKTAILEQGLKYTPVSEGFKGLDYSKLDVSKRDFVLANFGVPKNKLGIIEDAQYKSDEADRFFWSETMEPRLSRAEDHFNYGYPRSLVEVFHPDGDHYYRYERKNFEDDTVKLNNAMVMKSLKSFRLDEIRTYINVEPIGGKSGNSVILQQTDVVVEIDQLDQADTAAGTAGGGPPSTTAPDDLQREAQDHAAQQNEKDRIAGKRDDLGGAHQGNPGRAGGQAPLPGVSVQGNGNENGRTGAVDAGGHTASAPGANTKPGGKAPQFYTEKYADEVVAMLTEDEKAALVADYDRQIKAAATVRRNFRLRDIASRSKHSEMRRVRQYAEKRASEKRVEVKAVQSVPSHRPAIAALITSHAVRARDSGTRKFAPKLREAATIVRRSFTPVLAKAVKIKDGAERHAYLKENLSFAAIDAVVQELHTEAANEGWATGKRSLGFSARATAPTETKEVARHVTVHLVSEFLKKRYGRALAPNARDINDRMMGEVEDLIDEGLRRGYSPLQIANGNPDEEFEGVNSIFDGSAYDAERIARTESMLAYNWGAGNALLDSGATEEEALDGIDDPDCAARNGTVYEIDPETGLAVDESGVPVRDHPNGTLAFIPSGDLTDLIETGAFDVEELGAEWEAKGYAPIGGDQAARYHKHRNGVIHAHDGGHEGHGHRWSKMEVVSTVAAPKSAPEGDEETKALVETLKKATESLAKLIDKAA